MKVREELGLVEVRHERFVRDLCDAIGADPNDFDTEDGEWDLVDRIRAMAEANPWAVCEWCGWSPKGHACDRPEASA